MPYLKADVVKAVLEDLGVLDRAGAVSTVDSARVGVRFDSALAGLTAADVVVLDPAAIGEAYFLPLVSFVTQASAPLFHKPANAEASAAAIDELRRLAREAATVTNDATNRLSVRVLRTLGRIGPTANPSAKELATVTDRIEQVLMDLSARGIIAISDAADAEDMGATEAVFDFLVATLAPEQGQALPPTLRIPSRQDAERRLRFLAQPEPISVQQAVYY